MKIRIKSNYLTRYVLQDYGNKEALLPFFVCLVSIYLFFIRSHFFLCQFTVWRIFFLLFFCEVNWWKIRGSTFLWFTWILSLSLLFSAFLIFVQHYTNFQNREKRALCHTICVFVWFGQKIVADQVDLLPFAATLTNYIENESIRYAYGML